MTLATRENQSVEIDRAEGGAIAPVNNGIVINWHARGGSAASNPTPSPVSAIPNFLIPAAVVAVAGALIFQLIGEGIGNFKNQQLQAQNQLLTQQLAAQQAQIEGVKSLVCAAKGE
ncbi:hypothetical protein H6F90_29800 [Trichocoleus sp. FACHB-591]|uniref:hypothetical protein n=1 Tax=Trichocoleus sp. FACHB-591 TaxID=2692872 RepID=UPI00168838A3|nr:hypothetical protein [Trichocoleus sp. FACHB-591]MBD2099261.1 hypothetical protein [Trichocoleus sp. FACHB-591]